MYVKLFNSILDSSLAEDRRLRHFFIDLLLCSDADGNVLMTDHAISRRTGAELGEVQWGLEELQKPDPKSLSVEFEGRRITPLEGHGYGWKIINYSFYRDIKTDEQRRRETADRVRRCRAKKNGNPSEPSGNGSLPSEYLPGISEKPAISKVFTKPTMEEVKAHGAEIGLPEVECEKAWNYYESKGWKVGRSPMVQWRAALNNWRLNRMDKTQPKNQTSEQYFADQANRSCL